MNEKALYRDELEENFQRFKHIPHINKITVAGRIDDVAGTQFQYARSRNYGAKPPMYRTIVEVPSISAEGKSIKIGAEGGHYVSHIPIMCVSDLGEEIAGQNHHAGMFVQGTGRVQNYRVEKPRVADQEQIERLMRALHLDDPDKEILDILELNGQKTSRLMTTVAAHSLNLSENDKYVNEAILQGLIYMPPSLRETQSTDTYALHIKMLIKRPDDFGPVVVSAVAERDIINVMFYGEKAKANYPKLKQGYPILVKGRIESDRYKTAIFASEEQRKKIIDLLGIPEEHPILEKILIICGAQNKIQSFIKHDVWGTSIETSNFLTDEDSF